MEVAFQMRGRVEFYNTLLLTDYPFCVISFYIHAQMSVTQDGGGFPNQVGLTGITHVLWFTIIDWLTILYDPCLYPQKNVCNARWRQLFKSSRVDFYRTCSPCCPGRQMLSKSQLATLLTLENDSALTFEIFWTTISASMYIWIRGECHVYTLCDAYRWIVHMQFRTSDFTHRN